MEPATARSWIRYRASAEGLEWAEAYFSGFAFSPHRHDTYAVGATTRGVQSFGYRAEVLHARPGDVFVLHPDELHDGRQGTEEGFGYRILYISPELIGRAAGRGSLPFVAQALSPSPRLASAVLAAFPDPDEPPDALRQTDVVAELAEALSEASDALPAPRPKVDQAAMARVRDHLLAAAATGVGLAELERVHGIDRYGISRQFRRAYGVSPHRFLALRRLDLAKAHIHAGLPLAEAALAAGFADQSHMTRHFKKAFGVTPGAWRALLAA